MVTGDSQLSIAAQCRVLDLSRSTFYYQPQGESPYNLQLMRMMDEQYLATPFFGVGQMTYHLHQQGHLVNPKRVARLWRLMGLRATVPGPHTSRPHPQHKVYPYLLQGLGIERIKQVWMTDITYIPMARGFFYLVAIIDVYSRRIMGWDLSNSLDGDFCVNNLLTTIASNGAPEIMNTDQGSQFTSEAFTGALLSAGVRISMDGKGRAIDNVFIERFWRSLKYEDIYLHDYADGHTLHAGIDHYVNWYNRDRPHSVHNGLAPDTIYRQITAHSPPAVGGVPDSPSGRLPMAGHPPHPPLPAPHNPHLITP